MATNEVYRHADHLSLPVIAGTLPGDPVIVGSLKGVAQTKRGEGGNASTHASVWLDGAHDFEVDGAIAAVGTPVYYQGDGSTRNPVLSATATDNTLFGYALATKAAAQGPIPVRTAQV
ncbi:DUF2190 family protein [Ruania rhizosphaerae]|uniref:DUF2190 family protein n=1 Tax=Ruania rhizosphaerae TaxID=1840413 RepID=UPI00135A6752|nr:DUF2190 family protein [Ruania rhizosphaerae]